MSGEAHAKDWWTWHRSTREIARLALYTASTMRRNVRNADALDEHLPCSAIAGRTCVRRPAPRASVGDHAVIRAVQACRYAAEALLQRFTARPSPWFGRPSFWPSDDN